MSLIGPHLPGILTSEVGHETTSFIGFFVCFCSEFHFLALVLRGVPRMGNRRLLALARTATRADSRTPVGKKDVGEAGRRHIQLIYI